MSEEQDAFSVGDDRWHQAVIWHAHLREASEAEFHAKMQAWKAWEADAENREVFDEVSHLLEDGSRTRRRRVEISNDTASDVNEPRELLAAWRAPPTAAQERVAARGVGWSRRRKFVVSASAAAAACAVMLVNLPLRTSVWRQMQPDHFSAVHETALGEVRSDHLDDGSLVTLGAGSSLSVHFAAAQRSVTLERGEAWFQVAHDVTRPFVVTAGARTITAVGTAFVVQKRADRVVVTVTDGTVEVAPQIATEAHAPKLPTKTALAHAGTSRVTHGEQLSYETGGSVTLVEHADPQAAIAWSEGQLEFDHLALRDVVQVVNRYSRRSITVDESSGKQIFTGVVLQNQIDEWIRRLPDIYPVEIFERSDGVCVRANNRTGDSPASCDAP